MSKSMTGVFLPRMARPLAKLALVVVLPTPPLPEVTTTTRVMRSTFLTRLNGRGRLERRDGQALVAVGVEPQRDAHRPAAEVLELVGLEGSIDARNGDQLGVKVIGDDARARIAARTREHPAANGAEGVDRAVGDELRAAAGRRGDDHVATLRVEALARSQRPGQVRGCRTRLVDRTGGRLRGDVQRGRVDGRLHRRRDTRPDRRPAALPGLLIVRAL